MNEVKEAPNCKIEFVRVDGKVKVKATCQSIEDAIDLKDILDTEPFSIMVEAKAEIEPVAETELVTQLVNES